MTPNNNKWLMGRDDNSLQEDSKFKLFGEIYSCSTVFIKQNRLTLATACHSDSIAESIQLYKDYTRYYYYEISYITSLFKASAYLRQLQWMQCVT